MKPLSRRSVIAGSAAAVTAIPTVGLCKDATEGGELAVQPDPIFAAIAAHKAAYKKVDRLYEKIDEAEHLAEKVYGQAMGVDHLAQLYHWRTGDRRAPGVVSAGTNLARSRPQAN